MKTEDLLTFRRHAIGLLRSVLVLLDAVEEVLILENRLKKPALRWQEKLFLHPD